MNFNVLSNSDLNFYLTLIKNPEKQKVIEHDKKEKIIFFNPDFIISPFQIKISVNRAYFNILYNKSKTKNEKKNIIYLSTNEEKLEKGLLIHNIENNKKNNYYVLFINMEKNEIDDIIKDLKGEEINEINYCKYENEECVINHFNIKKEEIQSRKNGLENAVYNKISTKDLK